MPCYTNIQGIRTMKNMWLTNFTHILLMPHKEYAGAWNVSVTWYLYLSPSPLPSGSAAYSSGRLSGPASLLLFSLWNSPLVSQHYLPSTFFSFFLIFFIFLFLWCTVACSILDEEPISQTTVSNAPRRHLWALSTSKSPSGVRRPSVWNFSSFRAVQACHIFLAKSLLVDLSICFFTKLRLQN